ncbi:hypothetical protein EUX98_g883 [Antrodiella citrinella]|uniref:Uncharacterized protein n=1 Tax=Antrodiella citrinella TaxID=2447956 RepID=A0A4S4N2U6_9APHY|nr:hypothetical protein EUX98_g883 [Antrodiella citrinella]
MHFSLNIVFLVGVMLAAVNAAIIPRNGGSTCGAAVGDFDTPPGAERRDVEGCIF